MTKLRTDRIKLPICNWLLLLFLSIGASFIDGNRERYIAPIEAVDIAIRSFDKPKIEFAHVETRSSVYHNWEKQTNANWISLLCSRCTDQVNVCVKLQIAVNERVITEGLAHLIQIKPRNFSESFSDFIS